MTNNKRVDRGRETQRIFARDLQAKGVLHAESVPASLPGTDVTGWPGADVEVKATETASPATWLKQVAKRAQEGVLGLVVYRPRGSGPTNVEDWPVTLRWGDLVPLLRLSGHLPPLDESGEVITGVPTVRPEVTPPGV